MAYCFSFVLKTAVVIGLAPTVGKNINTVDNLRQHYGYKPQITSQYFNKNKIKKLKSITYTQTGSS